MTVSVLTQEQLSQLLTEASHKGAMMALRALEDQKVTSDENEQLKPSQLVKLQEFKSYKSRSISAWIRENKLGKIDRFGRPVASPKQLKEFLFNRRNK